MSPALGESHKIVTLRPPGLPPARFLCMVRQDADGGDAYYVMAENDGSPLRWRSRVQGSAARRLRSEFKHRITEEADVDELDVAMIFLCATEVSKA